MNHAANFPAINVLTPVGNLYLESSPSGLRRCAFVSSSSALAPADLFSAQPDNPLLNDALIQLREYFQGALRSFSLPLNLSGLPPFQTRVLLACAAIPGVRCPPTRSSRPPSAPRAPVGQSDQAWRATRCRFSSHATALLDRTEPCTDLPRRTASAPKPGCCGTKACALKTEN